MSNKPQNKPLKSVSFHFRFKFLAITTAFFLLWVILSTDVEFSQFHTTKQFQMMGPFFLMAAVAFLLFRKFPIKCPHCHKVMPTKKDWKCPHCGNMQGRPRYLMDKCLHCKQMLSTSFCDHCKEEFML